jgi:hypothetical protein
MRRRFHSLRAQFLMSALVLILCCAAINFVVIGLFHQVVDRGSLRHADAVECLEAAIELSGLVSQIDGQSRTILTGDGVTTAYHAFRRNIALAERRLEGGRPDGGGAEESPLLPLLDAVRQAAAMVFSVRMAALGSDIQVAPEVAAEARASLQAATVRLVDEAQAQVTGCLLRATRTADAAAAAAMRAMVAACLSVIMLLPALFLGYRWLMLRGLLGRLEVVRDAMVAGRTVAALAPVAVRGQDDVARMARALEGLFDRTRRARRVAPGLPVGTVSGCGGFGAFHSPPPAGGRVCSRCRFGK